MFTLVFAVFLNGQSASTIDTWLDAAFRAREKKRLAERDPPHDGESGGSHKLHIAPGCFLDHVVRFGISSLPTADLGRISGQHCRWQCYPILILGRFGSRIARAPRSLTCRKRDIRDG
jgi:hypothetical protein